LPDDGWLEMFRRTKFEAMDYLAQSGEFQGYRRGSAGWVWRTDKFGLALNDLVATGELKRNCDWRDHLDCGAWLRVSRDGIDAGWIGCDADGRC